MIFLKWPELFGKLSQPSLILVLTLSGKLKTWLHKKVHGSFGEMDFIRIYVPHRQMCIALDKTHSSRFLFDNIS